VSLITSSEEPLFISPQAGTEQSGRILGALAALSCHKEGLPLTELFSLPENPRRRGTKNLLIGPPPLTDEGNFLLDQKRMGRDMEYFMISARNRSGYCPHLPGIPCHSISEYGEDLIDET